VSSAIVALLEARRAYRVRLVSSGFSAMGWERSSQYGLGGLEETKTQPRNSAQEHQEGRHDGEIEGDDRAFESQDTHRAR
jgi:hypothetical protein